MSEEHHAGSPVGMDDPNQQHQQLAQPMSGGEPAEVHKVFVRSAGIGTVLDKTAIEDAFRKFGDITEVFIPQPPRGFCFVQFARREEVESAAREMDGTELHGHPMQVEVARRGPARRGGGGDHYYNRGGGGGGHPAGDVKPGDWFCPSCSVNNFARRHQCFRCGASRPMDRGYDDRRGYGGGRPRGRSRDRYYDDRRPYDDRRYDDRRYDDRRMGAYEDRRMGGAPYDDRRGGAMGGVPRYDDRVNGGRGRSKSR